MSTDVTEHDIWLGPHDIDHLNDGQPVFKGIGEDTRLVLRPTDPSTDQSPEDTDA